MRYYTLTAKNNKNEAAYLTKFDGTHYGWTTNLNDTELALMTIDRFAKIQANAAKRKKWTIHNMYYNVDILPDTIHVCEIERITTVISQEN